MSKVKSYTTLVILILLGQGSLLLAQETPVSTGGAGASSSSGTYTGLVETTYDDTNWVLVISDTILRENLCYSPWYEKVFNPCYGTSYNRYWKLESCSEPGQAFPMSAFGTVGTGSFDSLYVRQGFEFQLYYNTEEPNDPNDLLPVSPWMAGPKYVTLDVWEPIAPNGFEPGTFFVPGAEGGLSNYSIVIQPNPLLLSKVDDVNDTVCVYPWNMIDDNYLIYQICYENYSGPNGPCPPQDANNIIITDTLPPEVDFYSASDGGVYDPNTYTVTWDNIGNLSPGDSNCLQLTVKVNELAEPLGTITNFCKIESDLYYTTSTEDTNVCCWGGDIIYVDKGATTGADTGTSWHNAYIDLQSALQRARQGCGSQIWVAEGTYKPTDINDTSARSISFDLVNDVAVYGGFPPGGGTWPQRNPNVYETILSGDIGTPVDQNDNSYHVVEAVYVNNAVLDGFTITAGGANAYYFDEPNQCGGGIYCNDSNGIKVANCIITQNESFYGGGIYNYNSPSFMITNCIFTGNIAEHYGGGMYNYYESYAIVVNSIFSGNRADDYGGGISNSDNSNLTLTNCTIGENLAYYGGGVYNINSNINITNCILWANKATIYDEIYYYPSYPNITYSDVRGWSGGVGNINEDPCFFEVGDPVGSWSEDAFYDGSTFQSTLTDSGADWAVNELTGRFVNPDTNQNLQFFIVSNDVITINVWGDVTDIAKATKPYQIYDYHLTTDSPCIDTGYPDYNPDPNMKDIDGELRVFDGDDNGTGIVDMGADEYYWSPADFNSDGLVNFFDYALLSSAWLTDPNKQYYKEICDLVDNDRIDNDDLARFCEDWLWQTAWAKAFPFAYETMGRGMGKSMGESIGLAQELFPSASAKQDQPELTAADIEEIIKWLEDLWLTNEEVRKTISEDDWLKLIESVKQALKEELQN